MASITLDRVWLHTADNLSTFVALRARNIRAVTSRGSGRRVYAAGRVRAILRPERLVTVQFEAVRIPRADLDWIDARLGDELLYRDPRGRVEFGYIADLPVDEELHTDRPTVTFTFQAITGTVAV